MKADEKLVNVQYTFVGFVFLVGTLLRLFKCGKYLVGILSYLVSTIITH